MKGKSSYMRDHTYIRIVDYLNVTQTLLVSFFKTFSAMIRRHRPNLL